MPDGSQETADPTAGSEATPELAGFALVARRIRQRTTDLLAIAIIAIGIFAVSGRLSDWWNTPADSVLAPDQLVPEVVGSQVAWPEMDIPVGLDLGDLPVCVERLTIRGDGKKLDTVVFARLRKTLNSGSTAGVTEDVDSRMAKAAAKIERLVSRIQPVEEKPDAWRIYRLDEPGTPGFAAMFLGMRIVPQVSSETTTEKIAAWAMAMPWQQDEWKVWFFEPSGGVQKRFITPPDSRLTLSMHEPSGAEITAFVARDRSASISEWRDFFSRRHSQAGWKPVREWAQSGTRWTARFETDTHAVELILKENSGEPSGLATTIRLPDSPGR